MSDEVGLGATDANSDLLQTEGDISCSQPEPEVSRPIEACRGSSENDESGSDADAHSSGPASGSEEEDVCGIYSDCDSSDKELVYESL